MSEMSKALTEKIGDFSYAKVDEDIQATLGRPGKKYLGVLVVCMSLTAIGAGCWLYLLCKGMGVTGLNAPVGWGAFITAFVFWAM